MDHFHEIWKGFHLTCPLHMLKAENQRTCSVNTKSEITNITFGNFTMRRPFSKIVAEAAASVSEFPPLQATKQKKNQKIFVPEA